MEKQLIEIINEIEMILTDEEKRYIAELHYSELGELHFDLGIRIRNFFFYQNKSFAEIFNCAEIQPDDASKLLIQLLYLKLRNR